MLSSYDIPLPPPGTKQKRRTAASFEHPICQRLITTDPKALDLTLLQDQAQIALGYVLYFFTYKMLSANSRDTFQ